MILKTAMLLLLEIPIKFLVRLVGVMLFAVEAVLLFVPCLVVEVVFMTHRTPFHWIAAKIGDLSEWLISVSEINW